MNTMMKRTRIALAVAMSVGLSAPAFAQETASAMEGRILSPTGTPAAGTTITVIHVPTGTAREVVVGENGSFALRGLRVGGPYKIVVDSNEFQDTTLNDIYLTLGDAYGLNLQLEDDNADIEVISVSGSSLAASNFGSTGPTTIFNAEDLANMPAINRSITDVVRADPRVFVDESFNDSINCGGSSPRYNSLTLDGVAMNDLFGLNSNGYPTERMPFSYDAIQEVAVELAPFDVQYGGFTACNINAVTKSGTNEVHGGAFFDYTSDSFRGDEVNGVKQDNGNYTEKRYGVNVGLPLIEDKLFFFGAYEKVEGVQLFNYNALDAGNITQDEIAQITQIAADVYNYDVGGMPGSAPVEDEKILVKLDWNINANHRASFVYNWNDGFSISQSDTGSDELPLSNHYYERGAELTSIASSIFSDWTENFSTEFRIGYIDLENRQQSLDAASGFAEAQIKTPSSGTIYIGPDDSRQSNIMNYDALTLKLAGTYYAGDHKITAGIENMDLEVFNLFMQHTVGEYRFASIEAFEAGTPSAIYYNNSAGTNNPNDAAASFSYSVMSLYAQDEFYITDDIKLMAGLRYERYSTDDSPRLNQNFTDRYGFANTATVDGIDLLQPRVGFTWSVQEDLEVRGGFGLYSGGNPNVWISNAYSNDGVTNIGVREGLIPGWSSGTTSLFDVPLTGEGRPIYDIPQALYDEVGNTSITDGDGGTNATAPDFEIPSEWKYSVGATYITPNDFVLTADIIYTKRKDAAIVRDATLSPTGDTLFDGRPIYDTIPGRFTNYDLILDNVDGDSGDSTIFSFGVTKDWNNGFDSTFGYAYVDAEDVSPMTSSTAGSNYGNTALIDPVNPAVATSDYSIGHRFNLTLNYAHEFINGYATRFSLFATANEGKPYSFVYDTESEAFPWDDQYGRQLLYVPLENDPNVVFADEATEAAFNDWVNSEGITRGEITQRNAETADWWFKTDVRISQELPGFMEGHSASAFFVIENLTNLLNDDWGDFRQGSFVGNQVVRVDQNDAGQYVYSSFSNPEQSVQRGPSLWEIRIGVNYKF
ncbi:TonB-dependent receptor [Alteromonas pelagimontana]|uniref:TonB-dependent receptor n=1 Tax=Alteromonas pelagimontana TaxID=1858656 RepID=A0A6M4MEQ1_9ALTE|nr:TonB-dependent receptor [Alteromonas pelagimontana]QJR81569.1 TonB-dependent receptor [Alteromonas pelagimontana]